ncbi:DUF4350 domain-containing protein [Arthrobacter sp. C152]
MTSALPAGTDAAAADQQDLPAGQSPAATTRTSWFRRHRRLAAAGAVVAAALALAIGTQLAPRGDSIPLSAGNAGPDGAKALAGILQQHGVNVHTPDRLGAAMAALQSGSSPTLLLYDRNGLLDGPQVRALMEHAARVVVVTPRLDILTAMDSGIHQAGVVPDSFPVLEPGCSLPDAEAAGPVTGSPGFVYDGGTTCYRPGGSAAGLLAASAAGRVTVLGSTAVLANGKLAGEGNAALAIRLLGRSPDLVWYLPTLQDVAPDGAGTTLDDLAPDWARFLGPWLLVVAAAAMAWRGRRHGPLVFEPLPVVVKAAETAEGRARLYHDSHAIGHARDNLRAGLLTRLAGRLRLGPGSTPADIITAAAALLGRDAAGIAALVNEHPRTEARLVAWSQALDKLEKEVMSQ